MPNTPRGGPYPALSAAADVPFWAQSLAEWVDAQLQAIDDATLKTAAFTIAEPIDNVTSSSTARAGFNPLNTSVPMIAGHRYRLTVHLTTRSTGVDDVAGIYICVSGVDRSYDTVPANSGKANSTFTHKCVGYHTASATGVFTAAIQFHRALGTGTVTASSNDLAPATMLVEDMGVA